MNAQYPILVFPDTEIYNDHQFPLMIFGNPLYFLQPVEADPDRDAASDHDFFIERGLCQALTPAPLGPDRDRFLRLVHDIETRKDDYAAQLSALTVSGIGSSRNSAEGEQRHRIVSSLLGSDAAGSAADEDVEAERWQARLVLAIGEQLKREEADLRQELQMLDAQELEMFRSLQGEDGGDDQDPFAEIRQMADNLGSARPREAKVRFRAWLTLMKAEPLPAIFCWLATSTDAADQVFNEYEKKSDTPLRPILEIELPDHIGASPRYAADQIEAFQKDAAEATLQLCGELNRVARDPDWSFESPADLLPASSDQLANWNEVLDAHFPAHSHGRAALVFYLLPNCSIPELVNLETAEADVPVNALIGVYKRG